MITLRTADEIDQAIEQLQAEGLPAVETRHRNWELAHVARGATYGNILDIGCNTRVLENHKILVGDEGKRYGVVGNVANFPYDLIKGNFVKSKIPSQHFNHISCLSVLGRLNTDLGLFVKKCAKIARQRCRIIITVPFWEPRRDTSECRIFNESEVLGIARAFSKFGFKTQGPNLEVQEEIISSPVGHTLACIELIRN